MGLLNPLLSAALVAAALAIPRAGLAQNADSTSQTKQATNWIELLAEAGIEGPSFWSSTSPNERLGTNVAGSLLLYVARGISGGLAAEWARMQWTMRIGDRGHFDTVVVGPEARYPFNRDGRILPHIYLGVGLGTLSISPTPYPGCELCWGSSGPSRRRSRLQSIAPIEAWCVDGREPNGGCHSRLRATTTGQLRRPGRSRRSRECLVIASRRTGRVTVRLSARAPIPRSG